jgi:TPR repeat protein
MSISNSDTAKKIIEYLKKNDRYSIFADITENIFSNDEELINKTFELYSSGKIDTTYDNSDYYSFVAIFYSFRSDNENEGKYWKLAFDDHNRMSYGGYSVYHNRNMNEYEELKCLLTGVSRGDPVSMCMAGSFYELRKQNTEMLIYWEMGARRGNTNGMLELGHYYRKKLDENKMIKYYNMGIEFGDSRPYFFMGRYYLDKGQLSKAKEFLIPATFLNADAYFDLAKIYNVSEINSGERLEKIFLCYRSIINRSKNEESKKMAFTSLKEYYKSIDDFDNKTANLIFEFLIDTASAKKFDLTDIDITKKTKRQIKNCKKSKVENNEKK